MREPRRAALRADSMLTTVVQRVGDGCCRGRGTIGSFSSDQYLPLCVTVPVRSAASMISSASSFRARASETLSPIIAISLGMPADVPISSRPPVRWSSMAISSTTRHGS